MADPLDTNLRLVFEDRPRLARAVRAIQLEQDLSFPDALQKLHDAADWAYSNGRPTLRAALEWAGDVEYLADSLKLLERRDALVEAAYERAATPIMLEQVDAGGRVLLDQGSSGGAPAVQVNPAQIPSGRRAERVADIGRVLADPQEFERRLARMRRVEAGYDGSSGREKFRRDDRIHAESGVDFVRTAERPLELAAARGQAQRVAAQLDQAIVASGDKRARLKQLDAQLARLECPGANSAQQAAREQVRSEMAEATKEPLRMLDQLAAADDAAREQPSADAPSWEAVQQRMRTLDRPQDDFLKTLAEMIRGVPAPPPATPQPMAPPGVHPASHALDRRIRERLRELDRPESDYIIVANELMREEG